MNAQKIAIFHHDEALMGVYDAVLSHAGYVVGRHDFSRMQLTDVPARILETKPDLVILSVERRYVNRHVSRQAILFDGEESKEGLEALTEVRNHTELRSLPVIMTSPTDRYKDEAMRAGATDYFEHVLDNTKLLEMVRRHLTK